MAYLGQYNTEELTELQVILLAAKHLLEQGEKSVAEDGTCLYKGEGVLCCGAAPFVKEGEYKEGTTYLGWDYRQEDLDENFQTVFEIQRIHDGYEVEDWKDKFTIMLKQSGHSASLLDNLDASIAATGFEEE